METTRQALGKGLLLKGTFCREGEDRCRALNTRDPLPCPRGQGLDGRWAYSLRLGWPENRK